MAHLAKLARVSLDQDFRIDVVLDHFIERRYFAVQNSEPDPQKAQPDNRGGLSDIQKGERSVALLFRPAAGSSHAEHKT